MRYLRRSAFLRLVVLPFTLTLFLSACHKWTALEPPYGPAIEAEGEIRQMRVSVDDEASCTNCEFRSFDDQIQRFPRGVQLESPVLRDDALYSLRQTNAFTTDTVRIPLESLQAVEVVEPSVTPLVWVAVAAAAATGLWLLVKGALQDLECIGLVNVPDRCFD